MSSIQSLHRKWILLLLLVIVVVVLASVRCRGDDIEEQPRRSRRMRSRGRYAGAVRRSRDRARVDDGDANPRPAAPGRRDPDVGASDPEAVTTESMRDVTVDLMTSPEAASPSTTQGTITKEQWQKRMR